MGGLIFFLLILICSIVAGIEQLAQGRTNGLWYILVPGVIIVAFVIALIKHYNKDKKKYLPTSIKQKIQPKNDSFYDYWNQMREKALHGPLATEELYEHLAKVFEEGHYSNVEDVSKQGIKILKGTNKNGEKYTFFLLKIQIWTLTSWQIFQNLSKRRNCLVQKYTMWHSKCRNNHIPICLKSV